MGRAENLASGGKVVPTEGEYFLRPLGTLVGCRSARFLGAGGPVLHVGELQGIFISGGLGDASLSRSFLHLKVYTVLPCI